MSWLGFIDESEWQGGSIDFADEYSRYDGIILRAGHGLRLDKYFVRNLPLARAVVDDYARRGIAKYLGFYWYEEFGPDPRNQGDTFVMETPCRPQAAIRPPEFRCWDHEDPGHPAGMSRTDYAVAAISEVRKTGCCFGYSFASYDPDMRWVDASSGAWVAGYQSTIPHFPRPVVIWQDTDSAYAGRSASGNPDGDLIVDLARFHAAIGYVPAGVPVPHHALLEEPMLTPLIRRLNDDGTPASFTNDKGHDYAFVYDGVAEADGKTVGNGTKLYSRLIVGPHEPKNDGTFVEIWSGDAGETLHGGNLSAFYNVFPVTGNGRQSVVADSPLDGYIETLVVPA